VLVAAMALACTGCSSNIRWRYADYESTQAQSRERNQLTFVYFRSWVSLECTHFEDEVLHDKGVVDELRDTTNLMLEHGPLARKWGLNCVPSYAIVAPNGRVLESAIAPITAPDLVSALRRAKQEAYARDAEKR
jgi:hypothetical protein